MLDINAWNCKHFIIITGTNHRHPILKPAVLRSSATVRISASRSREYRARCLSGVEPVGGDVPRCRGVRRGSPLGGVAGGVPLLEPPPRRDVVLLAALIPEGVLERGAGCPLAGTGAGGGLRQNHRRPHQRRARSMRSFSCRRFSNAARYRSYPSRKPRSTLLEKMSSPRGFCAGGMVGMGSVPVGLFDRALLGERERGRVAASSSGRSKRKERGLLRNLVRSGGRRTFRNMLKERRARFAWGTYLGICK